jgi:glycosyltransferase involved in cell wall biosynthesis
MKILWLSHLVPYPPKGGVLQRSYNLLREISKYHEVDLLAFNQKKLLGSFYNSIEEGTHAAYQELGIFCNQISFFDIQSEEKNYGNYLLAIKSLYGDPYNINWLKSDKFSRQIDKYLESSNYDFVHFDTISLIPYFKNIRDNIPTILDHHNIESHMLLRRSHKEKNLIKKLYFWQEAMRLRKYEEEFCPRFSINITCSDLDSQRLNQIAPKAQVLTVPNGVDTEYFKSSGAERDSNKIVFVGSMNWYPNIDAILFFAQHVWKGLKKKCPALECHIVGANPPQKICYLSNSLPDFFVHGFVEDVRPFIDSAAVYFCPIRDGGGTKLKILDAMSMGAAIVAHPIACEGIDVTHGKNVLLAESPDDYIHHISVLLADQDMRMHLGLSARATVEDLYDYGLIGKKFSDSLQAMVAN